MRKTPDNSSPSFTAGLTLAQIALTLIVIGLAAASAIVGKEVVEAYKARAAVSQISRYDAAVRQFYGKYDGLPGDLLAITAEREGLPAGNGTPGHGDGDGNISPCNLGWQWHLGCETALFWSHLYVSGMISENFSADNRFTNTRLDQVGAMLPYLPQLPLSEGVYIAVWNTNPSQPSHKPQLPYGNYYEISRIIGVEDEQIRDDSRALSPAEAQAIDRKMDDGMPLSGRVVVNGEADWPRDAWGTYAKPGQAACVFTDGIYNARYLRAATPLCHLAVRLACCGRKKEE